ncbi:MAG: hypothetical protein DCF25_21820 [Leptolyngbya foveolarum]|uniref:Uncharacterized protein n=1 Tax=Leptolyngbya foveolarum TaxID=47253 RepID=A0A2W4VQN1_9CYAN|nr:MAG: hypothetical protein DCF25_21820 [Leptolyngbya foveolarum]
MQIVAGLLIRFFEECFADRPRSPQPNPKQPATLEVRYYVCQTTKETIHLSGFIRMKTKDLILQEMEAVPEPVLAEVLDFLQFLKAKRTLPEKQVTVVSATGENSIPLATLAMRSPEIANPLMAEPMPVRQMCDELKQALTQNGYTSREKIVELVQDVKREMLAEREAQSAATHA